MKLIKYAVFAAVVVFITLLFQGKFHNFIFRNKGYATALEVRPYIISEEQLFDYFCKKEKPIQLSEKALFQKRLFLLVELKNKENVACWGTLALYPFGDDDPTLVTVSHPHRCKPENFFNVYIIDLGGTLTSYSDTIPRTNFEWKELYTK